MEDRIVALTCICLANWKSRSWFNGKENVQIERGQFVRSWDHLAEACKLSVQTTRTSVKNLELVGFLTRKLTGHVQLFTIPKYDHYQDLTKYSDQIAAETNKIPNSPLTATQQRPNSDLTASQQQPNNKQESNKGIIEKGKNGTLSASAHNGSVEAHIISAWNRGPGFPISHPQGQKLVRAFIDSGVPAESQLEAVSNQPECKGKKFWEVIEPLRQRQATSAVPSIEDIIKNARLA
jgi:hypothetical protein